MTRESPEHFLNAEVVRPGGKAEERLKLWLSAANSEFVLKMKWARKPTIWMCTGLYIFEGTKVFNVSHNKVSTSIGLDSGTVGALAGVPLGGSITINPETSLEVGSVSEDRLVWAAQYRKLAVKYSRLGNGEEAALPGVISLYPDITSDGTLRDESDDSNIVHITIGEEGSDGDQDGEQRAMDDKYNARVAEAIQEFEEYM